MSEDQIEKSLSRITAWAIGCNCNQQCTLMKDEHPLDRHLRLERIADTITAGMIIAALWGLVISIALNVI